MHIDRATIDAVLADWTTAPVTPRMRAGLRLVEALTRHPQDIDAGFVESLRHDGLDDEAIEDAANVSFHFNFMNRFADAFDFPRLDEGQRRRAARLLDLHARSGSGPRPRPAWTRGLDGRPRPVELEAGREVALRGRGVTEPGLRAAVEASAARCLGAQRDDPPTLEPALAVYVDKLARWAYKVTDEDVDALREAGYADEAIFELTYAAGFGAAVAPLERLFEVMLG